MVPRIKAVFRKKIYPEKCVVPKIYHTFDDDDDDDTWLKI
jgi:hypothetical protein